MFVDGDLYCLAFYNLYVTKYLYYWRSFAPYLFNKTAGGTGPHPMQYVRDVDR